MTGGQNGFALNWFMAATLTLQHGVSPMYKRLEIAREFLSEWFRANDTFALLIRHADPVHTRQRIICLQDLVKSNYLGWLAFENSHGANIYFSINPLCPGATKRTKGAVAEARALYLDLDSDGDRKLAALRESDSVPPPSAVIQTSTGKYQVLWKVRGFTIPEQEAMLKVLAEVFGGDRACTDCARVFRLPGYLNRKYSPAFPVTCQWEGILAVYSPSDFRLIMSSVPATESSNTSKPRPRGSFTQSEHDWALVMARLEAGIQPQDVVRTLLALRRDKSDPHYYALRAVDIASAVLWARKGISRESIAHRLGERNSALATDRAAEIAQTAFRFIQRTQIQQQKEN
jgi:RepB DNA-primase from phage plasmid